MPLHPQTWVSVPGFAEAEVDVGLAPLIEAVWRAGIRTNLSCQANGPEDNYVWIQFSSAKDAEAFLGRAVGSYVEDESSTYQRAALVWDLDQGWLYDCSPVDLNLTLVEESDVGEQKPAGGLEEVHLTGQARWRIEVSVRFPRGDLAAVEAAFGA